MSILILAAHPAMPIVAKGSGERQKLSDMWTKIDSILNSAVNNSGFWIVLGVVGALLIIASLITYLMKRRNGGGGDNKAVMWTAVFGALCLGPKVLIPLMLKFLDFGIDIFLGVLKLIG